MRHEIDSDTLGIAYGSDHVTGYFLAVTDKRLEWSKNSSDEVNAVKEKIAPDGGGCYFNIHTGPLGYGFKVDIKTMASFWDTYGIPDGHVQKLRQGREL